MEYTRPSLFASSYFGVSQIRVVPPEKKSHSDPPMTRIIKTVRQLKQIF
jgi:hypothetical protein